MSLFTRNMGSYTKWMCRFIGVVVSCMACRLDAQVNLQDEALPPPSTKPQVSTSSANKPSQSVVDQKCRLVVKLDHPGTLAINFALVHEYMSDGDADLWTGLVVQGEQHIQHSYEGVSWDTIINIAQNDRQRILLTHLGGLINMQRTQLSESESQHQEAQQEEESGYFTDSRDGIQYSWKRFSDGQIWMTQNLNHDVEYYGEYCYNDDDLNCDKLGRLYPHLTAQKACPEGWHLPSEVEWNLFQSAEGNFDARLLKEKQYWQNDCQKSNIGSNGFNARAGGIWHNPQGTAEGQYDGQGNLSSWWSSTIVTYVDDDGVKRKKAKAFYLGCSTNQLESVREYRTLRLSVRCVKD